MKRLFIFAVAMFLFSNAYSAPVNLQDFLSPDDVTVTNLETNVVATENAFNSFNGAYIQPASISADALTNNANPEKRWYDSFNEFVITGLLPPTSASLISTTTAGRALIKNDTAAKMVYVEKDATSHTYTASKHTYVDLDSNGTYHYEEVTILAAEPAVTANAIRLALVSTDATTVNLVTDKRVMAITLSTVQDNYGNGLGISVVTPDAITITPGFCRVGTTNVSKTTASSVAIGTATDWLGGVSLRAVSTTGWVVVGADGVVKLTTTKPEYSNTSGSTVGRPLYVLYGGAYYRVLAWFYMNASGSGNIDDFAYSSIADMHGNNSISRSFWESDTTATAIPYDNTIPQNTEGKEFMALTFVPTYSKDLIKVTVTSFASDSDAGDIVTALFKDSGANALAAGDFYTGANNAVAVTTLQHTITADSQTATIFKVRSGPTTSGTVTFNGASSTGLFGTAPKSAITIEEIVR